MQVDLDAEARLELASMAYERWSKAWETAKLVRAETWESAGKFCPKADWPQFHEARRKSASDELDKAERVKKAICPFSPLILGE